MDCGYFISGELWVWVGCWVLISRHLGSEFIFRTIVGGFWQVPKLNPTSTERRKIQLRVLTGRTVLALGRLICRTSDLVRRNRMGFGTE